MVWQETPWARMTPFCFGFGENVHDAAIARGPVGFGDAVDEDDVDVVDA